MGFALPVTKGASDALFVAHATPSRERANQANHREIRAEGVSGLEGQARPGCAFVRGKGIAEPTLSSERWFLSACYPNPDILLSEKAIRARHRRPTANQSHRESG
jgi:hypothetical protein